MPHILIQTTLGNIEITLDEQKAPATCANFLRYVENKHYDGTIFHRVIKGFMIQGGGFDSDMNEKSTDEPIENEADNGLQNTAGAIAMARTSDPHSASAQFFINTVDNDFLNFRSKTDNGWGYSVFGQVVSGMDVVQKIERVATGNACGHGDVPLESIIIESCTVLS